MKLLLHLLTSLHGPKRRFASSQPNVRSWERNGHCAHVANVSRLTLFGPRPILFDGCMS
jgi:hypothetical protein